MFCLFRAHEKVTIYRSTAAAAVTPSRAVFLATIEAAVSEVLDAYGIDPWAVKCCASIDLKRDESGLLAFCREPVRPNGHILIISRANAHHCQLPHTVLHFLW